LLAKRPGRQGQEHLFPEHVFKRKATVLIIPDFCLGRRDGMLGADRIHSGRAEEEIKVTAQVLLNGLNAAGAGNLEVAAEGAFQADIGNDVFGPAVLMEHFGATLGSEIALLDGFFAEIDDFWRKGYVEIAWFSFQIVYGKQHNTSLRPGLTHVNARLAAGG